MSDLSTATSVGTAHRERIRSVAQDAPWSWLSAGWGDLWRRPALSLGFGGAMSLAAGVLFLGLFWFGWQSLILVLAGGFMLVGPLLAVGLYEMSRRYENDEQVTVSSTLLAAANAKGQLLFLGLIFAFVFFAWIRIAFLLFMLFIGVGGFPPASEFMSTLLFTPHGLGLLVTGTAVGAALAALVFAISVISVPYLLIERADAIRAIALSFEAIRTNPRAMVLWAVLIAALIGFGIATFFVGLALIFPLIGHATWHAFRALVEFEDDAA